MTKKEGRSAYKPDFGLLDTRKKPEAAHERYAHLLENLRALANSTLYSGRSLELTVWYLEHDRTSRGIPFTRKVSATNNTLPSILYARLTDKKFVNPDTQKPYSIHKNVRRALLAYAIVDKSDGKILYHRAKPST